MEDALTLSTSGQRLTPKYSPSPFSFLPGMRTKLGTHGATAFPWFRLWNLSPSLSLLGIQGLGHKVFFFLTPRPSHYSFSFQTFGRVGKHPAYTKPPTITEQPLPAGSSWSPKASGADNQRLMNEWNCLGTNINTEVADG